MLVQNKTSIYFAIELSLREISFVVYVHALTSFASADDAKIVRSRDAWDGFLYLGTKCVNDDFIWLSDILAKCSDVYAQRVGKRYFYVTWAEETS